MLGILGMSVHLHADRWSGYRYHAMSHGSPLRPISDGGGAFASLEALRPAAFVASVADTLPALVCVPGAPAEPMVTLLQDFPAWSMHTSPQLLQDANEAWEYLRSLPTFRRMKDNRINMHIYHGLCCSGHGGSGPQLRNLPQVAGQGCQRAMAYAILQLVGGPL